MADFRVISVDSGSSCLKMYDGMRRVHQPAVVQQLSPCEGHAYADELTVDGKRYVVGPTALIARHGGNDHPYIERGYHGGLEQYVQICHGLQQLCAEGHYDVIMQSLPYTEHQDAAYRARVKHRLSFAWFSAGKSYAVTFGHAATMPQGVGALRLWESMTQQKHRPRMVALVDLGSCTADFVTVELDERTGDYQYCAGQSTSLRSARADAPVINCMRFRDAWAHRIASMDGLQMSVWGYHELMTLPVRGNFQVRSGPGEMVDLRPSYDATVAQFSHEVARTIRSVLATVWYRVDKIILTGGGAELVDLDALGDDRMERLNIYANVEGQYLSATQRKEDNHVSA